MSAIVEHIERLERRGGPPPRTELQRLHALERANEIRFWRAQLKAHIAAGLVDPAGLLVGEIDERLATMKIFDLLVAVPKIGRVKADRSLRRMRISPSRSLGGLSVRQRYELVELLRAHDRRRRRTQPRPAAAAVRSRTPTSGDRA